MMIDPSLKVSQLMTTEVIFVRPDDPMTKVDEIFRSNNIHHLPVLDSEGVVVGIVSKTDYYKVLHGFTLFRTERSEEFNKAILRSLLVSEVMTKQVAKLHPDDTVMVAAGYFRENLFHALPVVDEEGKLVGILSSFDLLNYAYREPVFFKKEE